MPHGRPSKPRARLVVVDDMPSMRLLLTGLLRQAGFAVVGEAASGERAIALCQDLRPDLVLLDYKLPGISGLDVLAELKARLPDARIVLVTASSERDLVEQAIASHSDGYIVKPFTAARVLRELDLLFPPDAPEVAKVAAG